MSSKKNQTVKKPTVSPSTPVTKPAEQKKPPVITVRLLMGSQMVCPEYGDIFLLNKPTVVTKLSNWTRFQATVGLLEIVE